MITSGHFRLSAPVSPRHFVERPCKSGVTAREMGAAQFELETFRRSAVTLPCVFSVEEETARP